MPWRKGKHERKMERLVVSRMASEGLDAKVTFEQRHGGQERAMLEFKGYCSRQENNSLHPITITHPVAQTNNL